MFSQGTECQCPNRGLCHRRLREWRGETTGRPVPQACVNESTRQRFDSFAALVNRDSGIFKIKQRILPTVQPQADVFKDLQQRIHVVRRQGAIVIGEGDDTAAQLAPRRVSPCAEINPWKRSRPPQQSDRATTLTVLLVDPLSAMTACQRRKLRTPAKTSSVPCRGHGAVSRAYYDRWISHFRTFVASALAQPQWSGLVLTPFATPSWPSLEKP